MKKILLTAIFYGLSAFGAGPSNSVVTKPDCSKFRKFCLAAGLKFGNYGPMKSYKINELLVQGVVNDDYCLVEFALDNGANATVNLTAISTLTGNKQQVDRPLVGLSA